MMPDREQYVEYKFMMKETFQKDLQAKFIQWNNIIKCTL